eukprot:1923728-Pleurochrysis_carterae.AAC.1
MRRRLRLLEAAERSMSAGVSAATVIVPSSFMYGAGQPARSSLEGYEFAESVATCSSSPYSAMASS